MSEVLKLQNVCKSFGKRMVVQDISFTVEAGQIFGFLGPNGAGKTTTIKMILGLLTPDSGSIQVMGHDIEQDFEAAMHSISGIVETRICIRTCPGMKICGCTRVPAASTKNVSAKSYRWWACNTASRKSSNRIPSA